MSEENLPFPRRGRSPKVTPEMAAKFKTLLAFGMNQHDIAARFGVNQGRVSQVKTGQKFPDVPPAPPEALF